MGLMPTSKLLPAGSVVKRCSIPSRKPVIAHKKTPPLQAAFIRELPKPFSGPAHLASGSDLILHETDLHHVCILCRSQNLGQDAVLGIVIGFDLQFRLVGRIALDLVPHHGEE